MSEYVRLDNSANATTKSTIAAEEEEADDDDESYPMFITNDHNNSNGSRNNNNDRAGINHNNNNFMSSNNNNKNNSSINSNNHNNTYIMDHENTMEVPLLTNHENADDLDLLHVCRCKQPGFGASLMDKSAQEAKLKIILAISLCIVFMIIEFLGGYLAGSLAIMTDAAHLASDCISFVIGLVSIWLGSRPPDDRMSFGYKRTEVMGALVSIWSIWILTATLVLVAVQRLYSNDYDLDAGTMMIISGIGILINVIMANILHGSSILPGGSAHGHSHAHAHAHSHNHTHTHSAAALFDDALVVDGSVASGNDLQHTSGSKHLEKNLNLRAAMIHVIGDLVQSIGVFLAAIIIKFYPTAKFMDPLCTILFSIIVLMTTVGLFKESIRILSDAVPLKISLESLRLDLQHIEGVKSLHHLNVWNHTANHSVMMVHLVIDLLTDSNAVLDCASKIARQRYKIKHTTIQIERLTT